RKRAVDGGSVVEGLTDNNPNMFFKASKFSRATELLRERVQNAGDFTGIFYLCIVVKPDWYRTGFLDKKEK
ncbi:MAG: hypothetical protein LBH77_04945, partial [Tannerella sp.]|nr:hypothetical protein [Tannerella sp.]